MYEERIEGEKKRRRRKKKALGEKREAREGKDINEYSGDFGALKRETCTRAQFYVTATCRLFAYRGYCTAFRGSSVKQTATQFSE